MIVMYNFVYSYILPTTEPKEIYQLSKLDKFQGSLNAIILNF